MTIDPKDLPTEAEIEAAAALLEKLATDRAPLARLPEALRRRLLVAAGRVSRPERHEQVRMAKEFRRQDRAKLRAEDQAALEQSGLRTQRKSPVYTPLWVLPPPEDAEENAPSLHQERACYVCKAPFRKVHFFYDSMCEPCGDFNYAKRKQTADLRGRVALVTGGRVKIGYQTSLILLRAGAKVIVTTRFPHDAAARYAREPDYEAFADRLQVHGLDLRHTPSVELFTRFLLERESLLDVIVNNACQTVRRPAGFYEHLLAHEERPASQLPSREARVVAAHDELRHMLKSGAHVLAAGDVPGTSLLAGSATPGVGLWNAPRLSQLRYLDDDYTAGRDVLPAGRYDEDLQQVDLRSVNSWRLTMSEVQTPELLEVQLVNAVAPFVLNARLKPLMLRGNDRRDRHVINVSAMEGQFYRAKKTDRHPHTNMAKAALNMMTRTSAPDYAKDGLWMNAVDTGWVTDEDPAVHAARKAELGFQPPLDIIDGAARIVDPYLVGQLTGQHAMGQFLKDYKPAPW